jgi:DNA-binding MarR family transcriptional regulator
LKSLKSESTGGRLSAQGRIVLETLGTGHGPLPVAAVLAHIRRLDVSAPVARGSLSRTLRRLWAAGLVELVTEHATRPTLTEQAAYWRTAYATVRASPEAACQAFRRQLATPADDSYGSAAAYVDAFRVDAERPSARVRRVAFTPKGRERLTRNSSG